jgi:DinB superfamily
MGVTYTQGTDVAKLEPGELSVQLEGVVTAAMVWLGALSDARASVPEREGKWNAKQVIGHLTDSAVNNLGRIVRMQIAPGLKLSGYEQEEWVALQHYSEREWVKVLEVWATLNEHVAWAVAHVDKAKLGDKADIEGLELTLGFLIEDYIAHMEHHLRAMRGWLTDWRRAVSNTVEDLDD